MYLTQYALLPLLISPILLYFIYFLTRQSTDVHRTKRIIRLSSVLNFIVVGWGIYLVSSNGTVVNDLLVWKGLGFSLRIDPLNLIILGMISIIGSIVMGYSFNYLEGERNHNRFLGNLAATVAAVQLFVLSENLTLLFIAWVLTSLQLNKLLLYYPERRRAQIAAKKKFILARVGDFSMLIAFTILYKQFNTGELSTIFKEAKAITVPNIGLEISMILLAITAILKSAQIPFHGWLVEVMEAPTPVSALLHAGLINAGPFLMIRFAQLLTVTQYASLILFVVGGLSALYGAIVYSTQTSVKTALGYSSVAHMGFTIMVCGIGVYPASLLHLTAHSFYKAHAFLSSGSMIDSSRIYNLRSEFRKGKIARILLGIFLSITVFFSIYGFELQTASTPFQLIFVACVIFLAVLTLLSSSIDSNSSLLTMITALIFAGLLVTSFISLEYVMSIAIRSQVPESIVLSSNMQFVAYLFLVLFVTTVLIYLFIPNISSSERFTKLAIHIRNGLYLNLYFDKLVGAHKLETKRVLK